MRFRHIAHRAPECTRTVAIALLGVLETVAFRVALGSASTGPPVVRLVTVSSILNNPVEMAIYLVPAMPLLPAEVTSPLDLPHRDVLAAAGLFRHHSALSPGELRRRYRLAPVVS